MEKYIKDGKVGVIISPGYGTGFYTGGAPLEAVFSPSLITMIENRDLHGVSRVLQEKYNFYLMYKHDLDVKWIPQGSRFKINEYDGSESIEILNEQKWLIA